MNLMLANTDFTLEEIAEMENWEILMHLGWEWVRKNSNFQYELWTQWLSKESDIPTLKKLWKI